MELLLVLVLVSDMAARVRRLCPNSEYKGRPIPVVIRNWIEKPVVDMELSHWQKQRQLMLFLRMTLQDSEGCVLTLSTRAGPFR